MFRHKVVVDISPVFICLFFPYSSPLLFWLSEKKWPLQCHNIRWITVHTKMFFCPQSLDSLKSQHYLISFFRCHAYWLVLSCVCFRKDMAFGKTTLRSHQSTLPGKSDNVSTKVTSCLICEWLDMTWCPLTLSHHQYSFTASFNLMITDVHVCKN